MKNRKSDYVFSQNMQAVRKMAGLSRAEGLLKSIKEVRLVVKELIWLTLEIGTLIEVFNMITKSLH